MTDRTEHLLAWLDDLRAREVDELYLRQEIEAEGSTKNAVPACTSHDTPCNKP